MRTAQRQIKRLERHISGRRWRDRQAETKLRALGWAPPKPNATCATIAALYKKIYADIGKTLYRPHPLLSTIKREEPISGLAFYLPIVAKPEWD